ncbi:MAG: DUF4430 domain-containing protein [Candidatus Aenigmarchaeota archaeon]|nr:DUF4430 domain-containing protein [Candidatus Aenigmarchaeota archaeon]
MEILSFEFEKMDYLMLIILVVLAVAFFWTFTHQANLTGLIVSEPQGPYAALEIDDGINDMQTYNVPIYSKDSAFDVLKRMGTVEYEIFADGAVIKKMNGIGNDKDHYWTCFINDKLPELGCDYYYPNDGDIITFRYLSVEELSKYF